MLFLIYDVCWLSENIFNHFIFISLFKKIKNILFK